MNIVPSGTPSHLTLARASHRAPTSQRSQQGRGAPTKEQLIARAIATGAGDALANPRHGPIAARASSPAYQADQNLHVAFVGARGLGLAGVDKFCDLRLSWD